MTARIIDGKHISKTIKNELATEIKSKCLSKGITPHLVVLLIGENPASKVYVRNKKKSCEEVGMKSTVIELSAEISEEDLINHITTLNNDDSVHGILVQLPLPTHINELNIISSILPEKDVDGFHPMNIGKVSIGEKGFVPCTPLGVIELLQRSNIPTAGKHVVILGRSNIVGKPLGTLLLKKGAYGNATVTTCHSRSQNLAQITQEADILIAALGVPEFVTQDMIKKAAIVIDVGINRVEDSESPKGYKLVGDVKYDEVREKASFITPVPGGVGPMTIAMLLKNTMNAALNDR